MGELDKVLQAQHTDDSDTGLLSAKAHQAIGVSLQETAQEHEHDASFATLTDCEFLDFLHRQYYYDQVEDNVGSCRTPGIGVQINACSVVLPIPTLPGQPDWYALKCSRRDKCDDVNYAEPNCNPDSLSKPCLREDAEVEEQDRDLGQCD